MGAGIKPTDLLGKEIKSSHQQQAGLKRTSECLNEVKTRGEGVAFEF